MVAIYSTFLHRAYDQLIHDVALPNLPVVFVIDRAWSAAMGLLSRAQLTPKCYGHCLVRESTLVGGIENRLGVTHRVTFERKNATICQEFLLSVP